MKENTVTSVRMYPEELQRDIKRMNGEGWELITVATKEDGVHGDIFATLFWERETGKKWNGFFDPTI